MSVSAEEKTLLYDLRSALTKIESRHADDLAFPLLDEACEEWLRYRQARRDTDSVDCLELSVRSANILQNAGIRTIAQLRALKKADLKKLSPSVNAKVLKDIAEVLAEWDEKHPTKSVKVSW